MTSHHIDSKLFKKLLLKRIRPLIVNDNLILNFHLGFRQIHARLDQIHTITRLFEYALEEKKVY